MKGTNKPVREKIVVDGGSPFIVRVASHCQKLD